MDDRPLESAEEAIGRIDSKLADVESRLLARLARRPTGDVELAFRATPKPGTVFLHGQPLSRTTYAALWAWAQANGAVVAGGYGAGDGSTTFTVPDMRGKVVRGASTATALGEQVGADSQVLTTAQMPSHTHAGTTAATSHSHTPSGGTMSSAGGHGGHRPSSTGGIAGGGATVVASNEVTTDGAHTHTFDLNIDASSHSHTFTTGATGGATAVDMRQASLGWHIAVWT